MNTVSAHLLCWRSNRQKRFFGGVAFKFEPNMTVIIKNLAQKVDFCAKWHNNQDWRSKCADTVYVRIRGHSHIMSAHFTL